MSCGAWTHDSSPIVCRLLFVVLFRGSHTSHVVVVVLETALLRLWDGMRWNLAWCWLAVSTNCACEHTTVLLGT